MGSNPTTPANNKGNNKMNLTQITTPLGLLDANTRTALKKYFNAGGKIEFYSVHGWLTAGSLEPGSYTYRAAPLPPVTADELAEALRRALDYIDENYIDEDYIDDVRRTEVLLARYDAQKGAETPDAKGETT